MNVVSVENALLVKEIYLIITEYILEKNLINVKNVGKPSASMPNSLGIREYTLGRNLSNVWNVRKRLAIVLIILYIRESILEKNPFSVRSVEKPSMLKPS